MEPFHKPGYQGVIGVNKLFTATKSRSVSLGVLIAVALFLPWAMAQDDSPLPADDTAETATAPSAAEAEKPPATEAESDDEMDADAPEAAKKDWIRGSFNAGFDGLWSDDNSDVNLDQTLRVELQLPKYENIRFSGALWMHEDLDSDERTNSVLRDINDTYGSDVRARLLHLYAEIDDLWGDSTLRIGRQRIVDGAAYNRMDGLYFKKRMPRWDWYVFGGVRASLYEDNFDDPVLGGGVSFRLCDKTRIAADFYYGEEHRHDWDEVRRGPIVSLFNLDYPRRVKEDLSDRMLALSLWQAITPNVRLFGRFTINDGESDELLLSLFGYVPSWNFSYDLAYKRRMNTAGDRVNDVTAFYRVLGPLREYQTFMVSLHKPLNDRFTLSLEAEIHDSLGENFYSGNRDYQRYAAILDATNLFKGIDASLVLENWNVDEGESAWTVSGEVAKSWREFELAVGVDYERFEEENQLYNPWPRGIRRFADVFVPGIFPGFMPLVLILDEHRVNEREDIYSAYVKGKWKFHENQDLTGRIMFEEDDGPESPYWRVQVNYEIRF